MSSVTIVVVDAGPELVAVRQLFTEYQAELGIDLSFQDFSSELATLPGAYAAPRGRLLLASVEGDAAGCVGLRRLDDQRCELKRLFVRPVYRGTGLGRRLVERAIEEAGSAGYRQMCLDTLPSMVTAQALYRSMRFVDIPPYIYNPVAGTTYLGFEL